MRIAVTGRPGAGKTSVAVPLADALGYALVTKDMVKETMYDALSADGELGADRDGSRDLGGVAIAVMMRIAESTPDIVIESNFRPYESPGLAALNAIEVFCWCPVGVALDRYRGRDRHPVHVDHGVTDDELGQPYWDTPLGWGGPVIIVDTTQAIDIDDLVRHVRALTG